MATYIPGVTDYIPQIQPFSPDYNFYAGSLQMRQGKHDAAKDQLSTIYGSLLNAPLTRDDNTEARDQFFKTIDQDIQRMAGMDLSLAQNVGAAKDVFNQMLDNKAFVKDMVWTKNFQSELQRAEGFKNCVDPAKCGGGWWQGGEQLMSYEREDFRNATASDALGFANAEFTPYQDVAKQAMDLAEKANLSITTDQITGQWITTTKNGQALVAPLQNLFMGTLGADPKIKEYYNAKARLQRKNFVYSNKEALGGAEAAEQEYINSMMPQITAIEKMLYGTERSLKDAEGNITKKIDKVDKSAANAIPEAQTKLDAIRSELEEALLGYEATSEEVKNAKGEVDVAKRNGQYSAQQIDGLLANFGLSGDIAGISQTLAYKDAEQTRKVNPYALEATKFKNRMYMEEYRHLNQKDLLNHGHDLKMAEEKLRNTGGIAMMQPEVIDILGASAAGGSAAGSYEFANRGANQLDVERAASRTNLSGNESMIMGQVIDRTKAEAALGDVTAQEDLVRMTEVYLKANQKANENIFDAGNSGAATEATATTAGATASKSANDYRRLQKANTLEEKYEIAKTIAMSPKGMSGASLDYMYNNSVVPMLAPGEGNKALRSYLQPVYENTTSQRRNIAAKQHALEQMDDWVGQEAQSVANGIRRSNKYAPKWADAVEAYVDGKGHTVDHPTFISNMVDKGYTAEQADALWGPDRRLEWDEYINEKGEVESSMWEGFKSVVVSGMDAIATTATGAVTLPFGVVKAGVTGLHNAFTDDEDHWDYMNWARGFEYDSPTDVANWGGYGAEESADNFTSPAFEWEDDDLAMGRAGVHDLYKRAFSEFAEPDGNKAWLGLTGAGDSATQALKFSNVDPKFFQSNAVQGTLGIIKDGLANGTIALGDFENSIPSVDEDDAKQYNAIMMTLLGDMQRETDGKKKNRPIVTTTYSDIAGGDSNMVAANIKFNSEYIDRYKGSEKTKGIMRPFMNELISQGMTIYVDRNKTNNVFTQGTKKNAIENLIDWTGAVNYDQSPMIKDFKTTKDSSGYWRTTGYYQAGVDEETGLPNWKWYDQIEDMIKPVAGVVQQTDKFIAELVRRNQANEQLWIDKNK
jgi:hypothetical protein